MRISTGYQYGAYQSDISRAQSRYFDTQRIVSTGKKLNTVSDDPQGASQVLNLSGLKSAAQQYSKNLDTAKGFLGFTESALDEANQLIKRGYELAVSGANGATSQEGRDAMATEVNQIQQRLVELGNTTGPGGQYIFAGQMTDSKPFNLAGSVLTFNGDANNINVETSPNDTMTVNTPGEQLFRNAFNELESLKTNLQGGNLAGLSGVNVKNLQDAQTQFTNARGVVGTKLKTVEQLKDHTTRRIDDFTVGISQIEEVDMTEAIMNYQLAETAYQAALSTVSQASRLSLVDFIS
jgi:flagellar hook-associated protein 3 FlgL